MSKSLKNIGVVSGVTLFSRVLGLVRDAQMSAVFGLDALASAFVTAFTLPNLFRRLLGEGALTAAFVPTLQEELRERQRAGAFALVNQVASWLLVVTSTLVILGMGLLWLVPLAGGGLQAMGLSAGVVRRWTEAAGLGVILFPYLITVCLAAVFSAALQSLQRFLEPALSPVWLNLAMIGLLAGGAYGGWADTPGGAMLWLCGGALLGGCLQMLVPAWALAREGWRPAFDFSAGDPLRQIVRLMLPSIFGSAIYLINMAVSRLVGLSLNDSAVAALNLATRLMELPIGVFTVAVATVIFPLIAKHAAADDWESLARAYRKGMRLVLVINVPAAAGLAVLGEPIVRLLFQRGAFDAGDTAAVQPVLIAYALGLPFLSFVSIVLRAYYAQKDTVTPVHAATLSFFVNLGLSVVLMKPLGTLGLAIAGNAATIAQAVYLQARLGAARPDLAFRPMLRDLGKIVAGAVAMAAGVWAAWRGWIGSGPASAWRDALGLFLVIGAGAGGYAGWLWIVRIEGREDLAAVGAKLRAKFR